MRAVAVYLIFSLFWLGACGGGATSDTAGLEAMGNAQAPPGNNAGTGSNTGSPPAPEDEPWPELPLAAPTEPATSVARITVLESSVPRMAPHVVHVHALDSTLAAGDYHTARYRWKVAGPKDWTPARAEDPRPGLQEGQKISLAEDCEGFNFALLADVPGKYVIGLELYDEAGAVAVDRVQVEIRPDERTTLYVSGGGSDSTGDGTRERPYGTPERAWDRVMEDGKADFAIALERGATYPGFANIRGTDRGATNLWIRAWGEGTAPVLRWSADRYPDGSHALCQLANCENVVIQDVNFSGNDADGKNGVAVLIKSRSTNISLVGVTFGGPNDTDPPAYCVASAADNPRDTVPDRQSAGISMFDVSGHSTAYFLFLDRPDTKGQIDTSGMKPTTTVFECKANGNFSDQDDAYNGMAITIQTNEPCRNQKVKVLDYLANAGGGRSRFTLAEPLSAPPVSSDEVNIVDICSVGDSDVFLFGCYNESTMGRGTEVRIRPMMTKRFTAVGTHMHGAEKALQSKSGFRMLTSWVYLYRCAATNGGVQAGVDLAAGGIGPHRYQVYDRCYISAHSGKNETPINFEACEHVVVKASVVRGDFDPKTTGSMIVWLRQPNAGGDDVRLLHDTFYSRRKRETFEVLSSYWADGFLTFENNLVARGFAGYQDILMDDSTRNGAFRSVRGNVYTPDQGRNEVFRVAGHQMRIGGWRNEPFVEKEAYGSISPEALEAASFLLDPEVHVPETTTRTTTSVGVYQDYYGWDPKGRTWSGAVSGPSRN